MGDGTAQQGEVMEAISEASRSRLPVLFWIEDNSYAISTVTKHKTFYSLHPELPEPDVFMGITIERLDGRNVAGCTAAAGAVIEEMRSSRRPAIVIFKVERLSGHTSGDDERVYRSSNEIAEARDCGDPIRALASELRRSGVAQSHLDQIATEVRTVVRAAVVAGAKCRSRPR